MPRAPADATDDFLASIEDKSEEELTQIVAGYAKTSSSKPDAVTHYISAMRWMASDLVRDVENMKNVLDSSRKRVVESLIRYGGRTVNSRDAGMDSSPATGVESDGWESDDLK